jgi:hypothetical protein
MSWSHEARRRYYTNLRLGYRPLGDNEHEVAQAIADGANSVRDIVRMTTLKHTAVHTTLLNLRGHGIVVPPPDVPARAGLTIAPGYVVHKGEIFQLMKVGPQ